MPFYSLDAYREQPTCILSHFWRIPVQELNKIGSPRKIKVKRKFLHYLQSISNSAYADGDLMDCFSYKQSRQAKFTLFIHFIVERELGSQNSPPSVERCNEISEKKRTMVHWRRTCCPQASEAGRSSWPAHSWEYIQVVDWSCSKWWYPERSVVAFSGVWRTSGRGWRSGWASSTRQNTVIWTSSLLSREDPCPEETACGRENLTVTYSVSPVITLK